MGVHFINRHLCTLYDVRLIDSFRVQSVTFHVVGCSWKVIDHANDISDSNPHTAQILHGLQPYTRYAVYVQTYTILSAKTGARSPILYFTTKSQSMYLLYSVYFRPWTFVLAVTCISCSPFLSS